MIEYRVTKFDPAHRDTRGFFLRDDWTSFSEVGQSLSAGILTLEEYERVESNYVATALEYLHEAGIQWLEVNGLENNRGFTLNLLEGQRLPSEQCGVFFRDILREKYWCRFQHLESAFVHFGYDYYMYIGIPSPCPVAEHAALGRGLFPETFESPYKPEE